MATFSFLRPTQNNTNTGTGTDDQTLTFDPATDTLSIEDGNSIDLSSIAAMDHYDVFGNPI